MYNQLHGCGAVDQVRGGSGVTASVMARCQGEIELVCAHKGARGPLVHDFSGMVSHMVPV